MDAKYNQSLQLARPMKILTKEERAKLDPNVLEYIVAKEEEVDRLKVRHFPVGFVRGEVAGTLATNSMPS